MAETTVKPAEISGTTLGYAQVVADQGVSGSTDLTNLSTTVTVPTGGRYIKITATLHWLGSTGNGVEMYIKEGASVLQTFGLFLNVASSGVDVVSSQVSYVVAATAGSHTYKLAAAPTNSAVTMKAAASRIGSILVEVI